MKIKVFIYILCSIFVFTSCKKEILVFDVAADENLELPLLLNFNGKACFLDIDSETFKFPIDEDDSESFSALVEFQDYSQVFFNSVELENHTVNDLGDIEINKAYPVKIISNGENSNFTFYFTSIPLVQIITLDKIKDEPKIFARLIVNYTNEEKESENSLVGIEYRGASTASMEKKSYGIELLNSFNMDDVKKKSLFEMRSNNKWALDGMVIDSARMRNKISFEIWNDLPGDIDHIGIEADFVEVFHNYKSLGLYCFGEIYTEEFLSLNDESVLIVGKGNTKVTQFYKFSENSLQNTYWNKWEQKYPDPDESLNWSAFEDFCRLVVESSDDDFRNTIFNVIDINNLIDYYLFINVCYGFDNLGKNWFFLKKEPSEKFMIIPWDMDATWGRKFTGRRVEYDKLATNGLFIRLLELNPQNFKQQLKQRWNELKEDELSEENILDYFDENFELLNESGIIAVENLIWNANLDFADEQEFLGVWIHRRLIFMNAYIENL